MAKKDKDGNMVTSSEGIKKLYLETYQTRLKHQKIKDDLHDIQELKSKLWQSRLENIEVKKTPDWNINQLNKILKGLKNNKSRDPNGMANELLKDGYIGADLKEALLLLINGMKQHKINPDFMTLADITSIFKNKGSRYNLENDRGIFILTVMKKIFDKMVYADFYEDINDHMSDSNIGSRRNRNIKDHLLIMHGIINSVIRGNQECIDIQIYDIEKAFDSLWLEDSLNDIFDSLTKDNKNDKLAMLYEMNRQNLVAIKTPFGLTDRVNMENIVQQGGTWGPMLCSNSIDTIGKKCVERGTHAYLYKNTAKIIPLGYVDDLGGISKCGTESIELNTFLTTQIELKRLKFHQAKENGKSKCKKMHVGKTSKTCPILRVHDSSMEEVSEITYLGDIISKDGRNTKNIKNRVSKGMGIMTQIVNLMDMLSFGQHHFEIATLFRESLLINGMIYNSEIWYNLKDSDYEEFENVDRLLLCKILKVPKTTPKEAFFLELGLLPIKMIIKSKRLMYLHDLVTRRDKGWYKTS